MSAAPSPSSSRGDVVLQPAYFTSSAFVQPACADIDRLTEEFSQQYSRSTTRIFTLFKQIWHRQGWTWMHFKVFDARSRAAFLGVMMRLFSTRVGAGENPLCRVAALFGLYTIFRTQPSTLAPCLYPVAHVEVTCDLYEEILKLPDALDEAFLRPIRPHVLHVLFDLLRAQVFRILPHSELHPLSPRALPREVVAEDGESTADGRKKKGRPSRRERTKKARDSLVALERQWEGSPPRETRDQYASEKWALLHAIGQDERWGVRLRKATAAVADRMEWINKE